MIVLCFYSRQFALEHDYEAFLVRMEGYATPKCHILVGIPKEKISKDILQTLLSVTSSSSSSGTLSFAEFISICNKQSSSVVQKVE